MSIINKYKIHDDKFKLITITNENITVTTFNLNQIIQKILDLKIIKYNHIQIMNKKYNLDLDNKKIEDLNVLTENFKTYVNNLESYEDFLDEYAGETKEFFIKEHNLVIDCLDEDFMNNCYSDYSCYGSYYLNLNEYIENIKTLTHDEILSQFNL